MKEYMMIFRNERSENPTPPPAEKMQKMMSEWQQWIAGLAASGNYSGTNRLLPEGITIRPGMVITNGPYVELKEMVGGYLIVKANSLDEAIGMAKACPNLSYGGNVEVRAVMGIDDDPASPTFLAPKN
jgi:hypothetical protein